MQLLTSLLSLTFASSLAIANPINLNLRQEDQNAVLTATNNYRALHSAQPLVWNNTLATYASQVAATCNFEHSYGPYGENLAAGSGSFTDVDAADNWYAENTLYDYSRPGFSSATGHFTQLVWKATSQLGCARQACDNLSGTSLGASFFIVCEYFEAGNVVGGNFFQENVTPN